MSASEWVTIVLIPAALLVAGVVLFVRGRAALERAQRLRGGFGGPPGTSDVTTSIDAGGDADQVRHEVLSARRTQLWGGILGGVGAIWLVVALLMRVL